MEIKQIEEIISKNLKSNLSNDIIILDARDSKNDHDDKGQKSFFTRYTSVKEIVEAVAKNHKVANIKYININKTKEGIEIVITNK
jgi:hypothetical protein